MQDLLGAGKSVKQARKIIEKGIGFCGKHFDKFLERKEDINTIKQISKEIESKPNVNIKYNKNGIVIESNNDIHNLVCRAKERIEYQSLQEQNNIENVIKIFLNNLPPDNQISDDEINPDWIKKFFKTTAEISNKQIQKIWALILANQMKYPNTCSLRTLDILKNISYIEASTFTNVCQCVFETKLEDSSSIFFIPQDPPFLIKHNINYEHILSLIDVGLINPVINITWAHDTSIDGPLNIYSQNYKLVLDEPANSEYDINIELPAYMLTNAGKELFKIIQFSGNDKSIFDFKNYLETSNNTLHINLLKK